MHISSIFNGVLGFAYLGVGIWIVIVHEWLVLVLQGFTWLLLNLTVSLKSLVTVYGKAIKIVLFCSFFCSGILCLLSFGEVIRNGSLSFQLILYILSFPGSILFLLCTFKASIVVVISGASTKPLLANEESMEDHHVIRNKSSFARAGTLSRMTFWWLNPLMKKGKEKVLDDNDIPFLRDEDRAESCYLVFMNHRQKSSSSSSSGFSAMLKAIITWQWEGIWISGLYALIKVLTLSTGPLFLKAFIDVAQGRSSFGYQGYVLTLVLFLSKCLESLSERQWFFRTRLIGIQVRSMLSASIYKKQIRLSNAAKASHSPGEIVNYVTADAYRIGEFPYWFHQIWSTTVQLTLAIAIVYSAVGLAGTSAAVISIVLIVIPTYPMVKWQHKYQRMLMAAQDKRLKGISEALANMKVLKLYAWENHFRNVIQSLRNEEFLWISRVLSLKGHQMVLFWSSPIVVPVVTFWASYLFGIPLSASNVFTTLSSLRLLQEPIRLIPDVVGVFIEAKVSLDRIVRFLEAPELQNIDVNRNKFSSGDKSVIINAAEISWDVEPSSKATLRAINLEVKKGEKVAICGEVGSGKSTLLAAVLGEVARINGTVEVYGKIAYVSQAAWIQTGTIQENILFGSDMYPTRYNEVLERCSLVKDLEMLPFRDMTQIGERGVNLSGGQKQRVQLARALYQNADVYLLDDPFSAVDAHTATDLFNRYVMEALSGKTVLLVTHQVDFLPAFDSILLMSSGEIVKAASFEKLLDSSDEFQKLVDAHKNTDKPDDELLPKDQLIKKEEKEAGDTGFKPYMQYLSHERGILYYSLSAILHIFFILFGLLQNYYLAAGIQDPRTRKANLLTVYSAIGGIMAVILIIRPRVVVLLGCGTSKSIFSKLLVSLFRAPMSFYDSTPLGRVLSRVSADMSIVDLEMAFKSTITLGSTMSTYSIFAVLAFLSWPRYYVASSKELMRINGTSKSTLASHLAESIAGSVTIRAFGEEESMFAKNLELIDRNASPYFHSFSANEWLVQRLEFLCAIILSSTTLAMAMLDLGASASGFIGMELSYGLSLNMFMLVSVQFQCLLSNLIISVERLEQYTHIASEAPEVIPNNRPQPTWPAIGKLEISNLKVRYRQNAPLVLKGISFTVEGGHKVGIVGRTGSGKTTLISALFRLVEFEQGKIIIDGINISSIGLHDLRSHLAIIPQDPTLFIGTVRYNLDPLSQHTDQEIWKVLEKCHLRDAILEKEERLNAPVAQDGSNWSMGQRQLFCLGRAILKRSRILVLDEATASIDNATDSILQKTIKSEFEDCTVITVAHRIPTVMNCNKVLGISDGKVVEYDEPVELMKRESSLFAQLVKEYWSHSLDSVGPHS
ncbi:ABC transporter C family member 10 [Linum perenne]